MLSQKRAEIIDFSTNLIINLFPKYLYIIENKYDYNFQVKLDLIDIDKVFTRTINTIAFENYSDMQLKMLFELLDSYFINYEAREWTTFNYVTNFLNNNDNIKVADEVSFVKEEAFLKLIQEKIEDSRNLISLNYLGLKNHFLLSVPSQNKMNKIKKNKTENNVVFDLLDKIRENDYSKLELRKKLKKATDFDIDNLQYLLKDIEFYLFVETEEFECNFSTEEIEDKLKEFEDQGYTTEKMLTLGYLKEIKIPLLKKDGTPINIEPKSSIYVNKESLLFPYEFYSVYEFKNMVISEIKKHKVDIVETETTSTNPKLKTNLSVPELALLFKLLKDLKPNLFELKSEAELLRFISANFETKKTGDKDISTQKLRILFNQPDNNAAEFWEANLRLLLADVKKLK
jgi:hypothetical protein